MSQSICALRPYGAKQGRVSSRPFGSVWGWSGGGESRGRAPQHPILSWHRQKQRNYQRVLLWQSI